MIPSILAPLVVHIEGQDWLPLRDACGAMGLDLPGQWQKLRAAGWAVLATHAHTAGDGRCRRVTMLRADLTGRWLDGLHLLKVPTQARGLVAAATGATMPDDAREVVYFVQADGCSLVKIGTSANLRKRLGILRAASPVPLTLLATMPGGRREETDLHRRFQCDHGEWFKPTPDLLAFVASLPESSTKC